MKKTDVLVGGAAPERGGSLEPVEGPAVALGKALTAEVVETEVVGRIRPACPSREPIEVDGAGEVAT